MKRNDAVLKPKAHRLVHTLFTVVYGAYLTCQADFAECDKFIIYDLVFQRRNKRQSNR